MAKGKHAYGYCQRTGDKVPYKDLVRDGDNPGLLVSKKFKDKEHPAERPPRVAENTRLRRPSPDIDDDSPGSSTLLVDALGWDDGTYFGGET